MKEGQHLSKKLIIINGTMGAGKSAVCRELNKRLNKSVWLDGDWCWMMNPFTVNEENKTMVENNINFLLRSFLTNSSIEYVIFDWVIHKEEIFDLILEKLIDMEFDLFKITLACSEEALKKRLQKDIKKGLRDKDCINRSLERLSLYENMKTIKIDTSNLSVNEAADKVVEIVSINR